jgi:hypothetical protein
MKALGQISRGWSKKTTEYGAAVGVWPFTKRESGVPSQLRKTDLRKSVESGKAEHMPL